jgi:hypothetical protein
MRNREPTTTALILRILRGRGDFVKVDELFSILCLPGTDRKQLRKSIVNDLHWLQRKSVVDVVKQADGNYWFALPEGSDQRVRSYEEKVRVEHRRQPSRCKYVRRD